tara:strand:+ start:498 stop:1508 length:1011 start_codon:yes stop_codon:yes gene_type:complete
LTDSIIFQEKNQTGIILLNKPKSLNALDLEMAKLFFKKLSIWKQSSKIKRVLLKGEGKAFCAGGDVKSMFFSSKISDLKKKFLFFEYILNYNISKFPKPYLTIWNGIVMGGGVGLSIYGNYRIATENSKFAMPETSIGFFPDVGASYFLSRIKNNIGLFLGLTGSIITAKEMLLLNLATHYYNSKNIEEVESNYIKEGIFNTVDKIEENDSEIFNNIKFIKDTFQGDIFSIMNKLKKSKNEYAKKLYDSLSNKCPMSLAVTTELYNRAKKLTLKECLEMEFQLSQHIVYRNDFNNGVEAVLVSKTHKPEWEPKSIDKISKKEINSLFEFHTEKLGL